MTANNSDVLGAIIDATVNHHATIVVEPGFEGYEFIVHMLGRETRIATHDPVLAGELMCQFIDDVLMEVDG